jgi:hypothetical protein
VDERGDLAVERISFGLEQPDALRGGQQRMDGRAVLQRPGWPVTQPGAAADLLVGGAAAQLGAELLRRAHDQRLELVGRLDPGADGTAAGGEQDLECLAVAPLAGFCWVILGECFFGGADGIGGVGLGAGAAGCCLGRQTSTRR